VSQIRSKVRLIAHRGWSARFPENSLAAFAAACAAGAHELEFDVRCTADGVPVVCHDPEVDRVSDLSGAVRDLSYRELQHATMRDAGGKPCLTDLGFPTLEQVLALFSDHVGLNIHIKALDDEATALYLLRDRLTLQGRPDVYIAGDEEVLEAACRICPDIPRCCLSRRREPDHLISQALRYRCAGVQFSHKCYDGGHVAAAKAYGLFTNLFFADTCEEVRRALRNGVEAILTNDVGALKGFGDRPHSTPSARAVGSHPQM